MRDSNGRREIGVGIGDLEKGLIKDRSLVSRALDENRNLLTYSFLKRMNRLHPPVHLLRAFLAVTRLGSVSRAAQSLHLTQGAVSKRILELEENLGVTLFERVRRKLVPTPAAARYDAALRPLLAQVEAATLELIASAEGGGALRLSTLPTFGAKWLIPRLPAFAAAHPRVEVHFVPYLQGYDFRRPDLDCSILYGDGCWPDAQADYLTGREMVLIAPPAGAPGAALRQPQDVAHHTLLHHVTVPDAWQRWCEAQGLRGVNVYRGPQLDQYQSLIRAVQSGMGLALVPLCLVRDDIAAGSVTRPFDSVLEHRLGYWLCWPEPKASLRPLAAFRAWLAGQCAGQDALQGVGVAPAGSGSPTPLRTPVP